jgi:hypothetical protein
MPLQACFSLALTLLRLKRMVGRTPFCRQAMGHVKCSIKARSTRWHKALRALEGTSMHNSHSFPSLWA